MYQPTDLKKGTVIAIDGKPYKVIEYSQKVMGRGGSIVNVRLKNVIDGSVIPKTYKGADKIAADTELHFMDPESFEQFSLSKETSENALSYIKEGDTVGLQFFNEQIINIELPKNIFLKVTEAEDVVRGDTANAITKEAVVETGLQVKVPAFIKVGDVISVDTETGAYRERKKD